MYSVYRPERTNIFYRYHNQTKEVLVSVQRMEESLKRLKKVKSGGQNPTANNNVEGNKILTDDDKIRLQIQLDATYFAEKVIILIHGVIA